MGKASIVLWSGKAWESWGPSSISTGIGGSETAVIQMAKFLVLLGHDVRVIGDHEGYEGLNDGATWIHYEKALEDLKLLECDVLVSSRDKRVVRLIGKLPAGAVKKTILWVHDIHCGDDWELDLKKFDKFFCLSNYAKKTFRSYYPYVPSENVVVTRNGLDPTRFSEERLNKVRAEYPKLPRFTFSSSPDRGLDVLLGVWPRIRQIRNDAELHVYYGFKIWEKMVENLKEVAGRNKQNALKLEYLKSRVMSQEHNGVFYHDRVGQQELADSYLASAVWAYPTAFMETYCITALEAQAAMATPVTTAIGALNETVQHGFLIPPPNVSREYQDEFIHKIEALLVSNEDGYVTDMTARGRQWALTQTWESLASEWSAMFEQFLIEGKPL